MNDELIRGIAPFFIVSDVAAAFDFYCGKLGFEITFSADEDDPFFGIVQRGGAMIFLKSIGVEAVPNHTRNVGRGDARWDAYLYVPDPEDLAAEFASRGVEFSAPLNDGDGLWGFEVSDVDGYVLFFGRPQTSS